MSTRTTKTIYNFYASITYQIIISILSFIVRKIFLQHLSVYYLGIDGLFSNIINMLCLCDLGIGTAATYYFYKATAKNDEKELLLTYTITKKLLRYVACIIIILGIFIGLHITSFMDLNQYPLKIIQFIFFAIFSRTILNFFMGTDKILFQCNQQNYINMFVNTVISILFAIVRIAIIIYYENYIFYIFTIFVENFINFSVIHLIFKHIFHKKYNFSIIALQQKQHDILEYGKKIILSNINIFIFNSTDNIIISKFLGVITVGIMSNYYMIVNALQLFAIQILDAANASVSNFLNDDSVNTPEQINNLLDTLNFICFVIGLPSAICLFGLTNEFITLYFGPQLVLQKAVIFLLSLNLMIVLFQNTLFTYTNARGLVAYEAKYAIVMSILNIVISIIGVKIIGIIGVLLGTLISNIIMIFGRLQILSNKLAIQHFRYIKNFLLYIFITLFIMSILHIVPISSHNVYAWLIRAGICFLLSIFSILLFYQTTKFQIVKIMIFKILRIKI